MGSFNLFTTRKDTAKETNYKLDLFETVSQNTDVINMSAIKRYFNRIYDDSNINTFSVDQSFEGIFAAEPTNKMRRLQDYRSMYTFPEIASALDTICYSAESQDESNQLVTLRIKDDNLLYEIRNVEHNGRKTILEHYKAYLTRLDNQ